MTTFARPTRIAASPYARRLAREAGLPLARLAGSGPAGRIVARDLQSLPTAIEVPPPAIAVPAAPVDRSASASRSAGALAASLSLRPVQDLIEAFARAGRQIAAETLLDRALPDHGGVKPALLILRGPMLRPVAMPLPPDSEMQLTACLDEANGVAELLLCFAVPAIEPRAAADLLAEYRDNLLNPLRLFA